LHTNNNINAQNSGQRASQSSYRGTQNYPNQANYGQSSALNNSNYYNAQNPEVTVTSKVEQDSRISRNSKNSRWLWISLTVLILGVFKLNWTFLIVLSFINFGYLKQRTCFIIIIMLPRLNDKLPPLPYYSFTEELINKKIQDSNIHKLKMLK